MKPKIGSLFDGSGGFPLAAIMCGIKPVWAAEVEPYPIAVTRSRFPSMKHLGSVTDINGAEVEPVDVITFGSPCQDLSVAGKRAGLKHTENGDEETTRSGLFMEAVRIIKEMREASGVTAFSFDSLASNSMKSANPHSGCRQVEVSKCLDTTNPDPSKNQGGVAVVEAVPYTLKIRGGVEIDSAGKAAGKGALIQNNLSATLGVSQDQYLFQPIKEQHLFENHSQDARYKGPLDVCPMLPAQLGTGGNNQPFVVEKQEPVVFDGSGVTSPVNASNPQPGDPCHTLSTDSRNYLVYCLQGNGIDRADTARCNGKGVKEDICYTLNTIDRPAVAFAETYQKVTGPLMANSHHGSYTGQDAYNDMFVVGKEDVAAVDCRNATENPEVNGTLQAKANGGFSANCNQIVRVRYIVRRLTPTECARLQGFPDDWGHPDVKDSLTDEEYTFWLNVRNTHAAINDKAVKDYTKEQMLTWYNKLHTDSSEYKLWGNGIALPCALYVMQGIAEALNES